MEIQDTKFYLVFAAFAALVSVAMWIDYFRKIDVFEKEKVAPLLVALIIGGCTPYLALYLYDRIEDWGFEPNGRFLNDLLYAIFAIGMNEEFCKLVGVFFAFFLLKKQINEPIDVMIYAGVTALGFSMVENYNYFNNHGIRIITSRTFYSALEHIINTSIIIYSMYRYRLFKKGNPAINTITGILIAIFSHGLFDFFLTDSFPIYLTAFLSIIVYMVGINFWIQMLNNANNYSNFFDYDKIHFSPRIVFRLLLWYALTIVIAFANNWLISDFKFALITLVFGILSDGLLFLIVILRVSRFKILQARYLKVKLEFPFYITKNNDEDFKIPFFNIPFKVRGENYREHLLTRFLNRKIWLYPVDEKTSFLKSETEVLISEKYLLFDDVVVYSIAFLTNESSNRLYLLKPRMGGLSEAHHRYPVHGLHYIDLEKSQRLSQLNYKDLVFMEWVYLKTTD